MTYCDRLHDPDLNASDILLRKNVIFKGVLGEAALHGWAGISADEQMHNGETRCTVEEGWEEARGAETILFLV